MKAAICKPDEARRYLRYAGRGPRLGLNQAWMCCRWRHENGRGGEVYSKCGVGKENARKVGKWLRY